MRVRNGFGAELYAGRCMRIVGHKDYVFEESQADKKRREAQELLNRIENPNLHPRDKIHLMQQFQQQQGM